MVMAMAMVMVAMHDDVNDDFDVGVDVS